ncbi:cellulose binding domain-containing protein [Plantactinospora solaniradicis]|uniref:Cellulose binding domain-containing protein n=1 Tax=Plantactinospora solaniradicis TaxID=1723736 RepID=A0ABW1KEG3_9ACTN
MTIPISRRAGARALAAALALGIAAALLLPGRADAAISSFEKVSEWSNGYIGKMTIHNDAPVPTTGWRVEFELPAGTSIGQHWNADLTRAGARYVFTSLAWNGTVAAGASTSFGWVASGTGTPQGCLINNVACAGGGGPDVTPPVIPANPRTEYGSQTLTLRWDASTDDRGVTGYELFSNGTRFASTTGTSHTMPVPPPMIFTFGIRAIDAAGNSSPFAIIKLGAIPDSDPPTAPTNLRLTGPRDGHYRLTWDASRDNVFVAGYRVQQTGTVSAITMVGDTFAYGLSRGYGIYMFEVRAFDSSGNFSAPANIGIAVDPPPPTLTP